MLRLSRRQRVKRELTHTVICNKGNLFLRNFIWELRTPVRFFTINSAWCYYFVIETLKFLFFLTLTEESIVWKFSRKQQSLLPLVQFGTTEIATSNLADSPETLYAPTELFLTGNNYKIWSVIGFLMIKEIKKKSCKYPVFPVVHALLL